MVHLKWRDDTDAESMLNDMGIEFRLRDYNMADIDLEEGKINNARMSDPLNDSLVEEFALAMERGNTFPRPLVLARKAHKALPLSGNHRMASADMLGAKIISCYEITSDDRALVDLLPRALNRLHGARQSKEEAIQHAMYAIQEYGYTVKQAAQLFCLRDKTISDEIRFCKQRDFLESKSIPARKLQKTAVAKIGMLSGNENVMVAAARLAVGQQVETVSSMVDKIRAAKTEATQMAVVADYESRLAIPEPAVKQERQLKAKFLSGLTTLENLVEGRTSLAQVQITKEADIVTTEERLLKLAAQLTQLATGKRQAGKARRNGRT